MVHHRGRKHDETAQPPESYTPRGGQRFKTVTNTCQQISAGYRRIGTQPELNHVAAQHTIDSSAGARGNGDLARTLQQHRYLRV